MSSIDMTAKLKGEYKISVTRPDGTVEESGWFNNVILNQGLDRFGQGGALLSFAKVGTGTSTPSILQTTLDAQVAASGNIAGFASSSVNSGPPAYKNLATYTFVFVQGAVVGNITEIGVGWAAAAGNNLFSRALILDNAGNPTSVTLVAIDQLTVYYRLTWETSLTDITGTAIIGGTSYNYTMRIGQVGSFASSTGIMSSVSPSWPGLSTASTYAAGAVMGPVTGSMTGTGVPSSASWTYNTYAVGNYYRDATLSYGITQGNHPSGIQGFVFNSQIGSVQMLLSAPIPKNDTNVLTLTLRISWARA